LQERLEFRLLLAFLRRPGRVLSRENLRSLVASQELEPYERSIDMLVSRLRGKLEANRKAPRFIVTVPGTGYKFAVPVEREPTRAGSAARVPSPAQKPTPRGPAERCLLTVLSCTVIGLAMFAKERDPEEVQALIGALHGAFTAAVDGFGGVVASFLGDNMLAYFGYPQAHEDDAERAIRAGLELIDPLAGLASSFSAELHLRVGIATRLTVVGEMFTGGGREFAAVGEAPWLACLLNSAPARDAVNVGDNTRRLAGGAFNYEPIPPVQSEGLGEPLRVWRVLGATSVSGRFAARHGAGMTHFVGRGEEAELLERRWWQARHGAGQVVVVVGEPGIGKSRLAVEFERRIAGEDYVPLRCFGSPYHTNSVLIRSSPSLRPLLMIFEEVQWFDATTLELLALLLERAPKLPIPLLATTRPEFTLPWAEQAQVTVLQLNRLGPQDAALLVGEVAGDSSLDKEVARQIVERADGIPLFLEELTKTALDEGPKSVGAVPITLQGSLMERLDRLGPAKAVAQTGAVIGRTFSDELLRLVQAASGSDLDAAPDRLVNSGLVFRRGAPPDATYQFKHALVRDAAYDSLSQRRRRAIHARIAEALEERFPEIVERQPELLAQHYAEAGLVEQSVAYWGKAGRRSAARSATAEAAAQFEKALDQLLLLPDSSERHRQELEFRSSLGAVLQALKGYAAPETGHAYSRALELWEQLGSPSEFRHVPYGQSLYYASHGELDLALRLNENLLCLSRQRNDFAGLIVANLSSGRNQMFVGRFALSQLAS
jgi:class 3 adenylate cyclase